MTKFTKGIWTPDFKEYKNKPKKIYLGVKVEIQPNYFVRLFDTILPETDKKYIEEHEEIEANVLLICDAPKMLEIFKHIYESPVPSSKNEFENWYNVVKDFAKDILEKHKYET